MVRPGTLAALAILAVAVTCASAGYQRVGATRMVEGEAWCRTPGPCPVPVLAAGLPLPYLVDDPQVSVPNAIRLVEDDFRAGAFVLDVLAWFALALIIHHLLVRRRIIPGGRPRKTGSAD
ncbi:MAG TPA: hypothetical protein VHG08_10960 [Longimicrobium sp.]|nr:hypothetical protein [Longimicrobium sp.]